MSRLRTALIPLAAALVALAAAQAPFKPVPGTAMVKTSDYGELPKEIVWNKDGAVMVLVPGGTSKLGRGTAGDKSLGNEGPEITVELPTYYIDKYEVSNRAYSMFVEATGGTPSSARKETGLTKPELPVVAILHASAGEYAKWARKEMPTEAMWEKAARGPEGHLFTTGDSPDFSKYVLGLGANGPSVPVDKDTGDVSGYGALHMTGNVREWVADYYERDAYATANKKNPTGPASGELRVTRGSGYFTDATEDNARITRREAAVPTQTRDDLGFRTVFVLRPAPKVTPSPSPSPTPAPYDPKEDLDNAFRRLGENWSKAASRPEWRSPVPKGSEIAEIANYTGHTLRVCFVTIDGGVTIADRVLDPYAFSTLDVPFFDPSLRTYLAVGAMDEQGRTIKVVNAGEISAAKNLTAILPPSLIDEVSGFDGKPIADAPRESLQFYDNSYVPQWDELEFQNRADLPIALTLTELDKAQNPVGKPLEMTIPAGGVFSGKLKNAMWQSRVSYVGSKESAAPPWNFKVDASATRRLIRYTPDSLRQDRVIVFAKKVPFLNVEMLESKRITIVRKK